MPSNIDSPETQSLYSKYGLAGISDSTARLSDLVANRNAELTQIAKLIAADTALTKQVLGDDAGGNDQDEIERQIFRLGVEPILIIAMTEPLVAAVRRTFSTMAGIDFEKLEIVPPEPTNERRFISNLSIKGRANGKVYLRLEESLCRQLAGSILGTEAVAANDLVDVLAELSNMIVGNFQSNLTNASLSCRISVPQVEAAAVFAPPKVMRGRHRAFRFVHGKTDLLVDLIVEFAD